MSEAIKIEATVRTKCGKNHNRKLRTAGKIPAVLLEKGKSTSIELDPKLLSKAWKSEGHQFELTLDGVTTAVKIHELQIDPVKRHALHVDLMRV